MPIGITAGTMRLLDVFLLHCLLCDSPPDTPQELAAIVGNKQRVASRGREPGLRLDATGREEVTLAEWGGEVLAECEPIAAALDAANGGSAHREALATAVAALDDPASTPSARVLQAMARDHSNSYVHFVLAQPRAHRDAILEPAAVRGSRQPVRPPGGGIAGRAASDRVRGYRPSKPSVSSTWLLSGSTNEGRIRSSKRPHSKQPAV